MRDDSPKPGLFGLARRALTRAAEKLAEAAGIPMEPAPPEPLPTVVVQPRPDAETLPPPVPAGRLAADIPSPPAAVVPVATKPAARRERPYRTGEIEEAKPREPKAEPHERKAEPREPKLESKTQPREPKLESKTQPREPKRRRPPPTEVFQPTRPPQRAPEPTGPANDEVTVAVRDRSLVVQWTVSSRGVARAVRRAAVKGHAPLTLRMHTVLLRDDGRIDQRTRDLTLPPNEPIGRHTLGVPPVGTHVTCAVGYATKAHAAGFIPIAHSSRLQVLP